MLLPPIRLYKKQKRGLELVSLSHFLHCFSRKIFLLVYSITWPNSIVWLPLLLEILYYMCTLRCLINVGGRLLIFRFFTDSPQLIRTLRLLVFKECWSTKYFSVAEWVFLVYGILFFQFRRTWLFYNVLFCNIWKFHWLFI